MGHLDSVANSEELRTAYNTMLPDVSNFLTNVALNTEVWQVLKAAGARLLADGSLHPHRRRYVEETMADFVEAGADLDAASKQALTEVQAELS
ncbi:hypothetical protein RZS08_48255, partial [Arthrospira platensis SPKY1]|nr:hypothetical protein [Arthrospira platensis SPKY1]